MIFAWPIGYDMFLQWLQLPDHGIEGCKLNIGELRSRMSILKFIIFDIGDKLLDLWDDLDIDVWDYGIEETIEIYLISRT